MTLTPVSTFEQAFLNLVLVFIMLSSLKYRQILLIIHMFNGVHTQCASRIIFCYV